MPSQVFVDARLAPRHQTRVHDKSTAAAVNHYVALVGRQSSDLIHHRILIHHSHAHTCEYEVVYV